ncbi:MAG: hypothetical protein LUI39_01455 [Lachnospiraceae bacterium]|nr:hypothetical protein [Lachnospiraceae bacterium]
MKTIGFRFPPKTQTQVWEEASGKTIPAPAKAAKNTNNAVENNRHLCYYLYSTASTKRCLNFYTNTHK